MKDLLEIFKFGGIAINSIVNMVGWLSLGLIVLSNMSSLAFIPKAFVLYVLTH